MSRILIIGAGSAGSVVVKKCCQLPEIFTDIHVASRRLSSCETLQQNINHPMTIHQVDADDVEQVTELLQTIQPFCVINMALPYQDLPIMDACLKAKVHYIDTANYEPKDDPKFCYKWQWDYHDRFKEAGIMALLGSGFDPGVTNVFCAYAQQHLFDQIQTIDIIDCNDGDHGHPFATNFNPEINIREITQRGKYWHDNTWVETDPLSVSQDIMFPEVGHRKAYLMYHEEIESLAKHLPTVERIRFWMTFSESYLTHLNVLQNVGMTSIKPIDYEGQSIAPLSFLKAVLPDPSSLGKNYQGKTCIGCVISGKKDNVEKKVLIYNICHHEKAYEECQAQAVGYTTGVPAMIGAKMLVTGQWMTPGVINIEQCDPTPFMTDLNQYGLPWKVIDYDHII